MTMAMATMADTKVSTLDLFPKRPLSEETKKNKI
jgi:hypothetical protein